MISWCRFRILPLIVVLMLIVATTLVLLNWLRMSHAGDVAARSLNSVSGYRQAPMATPVRQTALFVGDDFAAWGQGYYTYPYMVCDAFALNCNVDAQVGTGYINDGHSTARDNTTVIDRLPRDQTFYDANLIIVDAGRNDLQEGVQVLGDALGQYLSALREHWPEAKIAVIAPWVMSSEQLPNYADIVSVVCNQSEIFGAVCIDPLGEGWFDDVDMSTLHTPGSLHPNQAGHTLIGKKLAESLRQHGLVERGALTP